MFSAEQRAGHWTLQKRVAQPVKTGALSRAAAVTVSQLKKDPVGNWGLGNSC